MLKPALFAITGAAITASAYFSRACPPLLAAAQLFAYAIVYCVNPVASAPARAEQFFGYVSVGAFLYFAKFFEYWTLGLAGPLARQAAFFPVPLVLSFGARAFPDSWNEEYHALNRWEIALQALFLALMPTFALARPEPGALGALTAAIAWIATGAYSVTSVIVTQKDTGKSVVDVRANAYASAAAIALLGGAYSISAPPSYLWLGLFVSACLAHAAVRKWHEADEGAKGGGDGEFPGEWSALRAALVLTWAWLVEWQGVLVLYLAAVALQAYFFRSRRRRRRCSSGDVVDAGALAEQFE